MSLLRLLRTPPVAEQHRDWAMWVRCAHARGLSARVGAARSEGRGGADVSPRIVQLRDAGWSTLARAATAEDVRAA